MADPRTFVLIGDFQDNITPALEGINKGIAGLKRTMATMTTKRGGGFSDVTQSVGKLISSQKHLANSIKEVGDAAKVATGELKEYKQMAGKVASAHYHLARAGQQAGDKLAAGYNNAYSSLDKLDRRQKLMASANRRRQRLVSSNVLIPSRGGTGGTFRSPRFASGGGGMAPPGGGSRGGGGGGMVPPEGRSSIGGGGGDFPMARFTLAFGLSEAISAPITSAITTGFQIGTDMMMRPFQYFVGAFGERVGDQLDDLKAAGALLSISKRSKNPFVANIDEAISLQQETNATFAKMAAQLPGVTHDYVLAGKRLSDTMARVVESDYAAARLEANKIRATEEGAKFFGGTQITGESKKDRQEVFETLLGDLTKKATLAGIGGRTGAGGVAGAYGLPGLIERMVSQDQVSMGQFQRYASVFSDPSIADALSRNIDKINASNKNSVERTKAISKLLDEVVTPELIDKLRTSVDGIYQGLKSAFLDPDTGLFGLGRQFKDFGKRMNSFGQYVDDAGNVVTDITKAASENLSLFEILAQIFSNVGQVLGPIIDNITLLFDPMEKVASILMEARHYTGEFARSFNQYREGLKELSKQKGKEFLKDTLDFRASLAALNNLMKQFNIIDEAEFKKIGQDIISIKDPTRLAGIVTEMFDKLINSEVAGNIGKMVGEIIGTVLVEVSQVTGFLSNRLKGSNKLFDGLKAGFNSVNGGEAFANIFKDVFKLMFEGLKAVLKVLPLEAYILGGLMFALPLAIQTFAMAFSHRFSDSFFDAITGFVSRGKLDKCMMSNRAMLQTMCQQMSGGGGGGGATGGSAGRSKKRRGFGDFFIGSKGARAAGKLRSNVQTSVAPIRSYLTEPVVRGKQRIMPDDWNIKGPLPRVALGLKDAPYTRGQQIQRGAQALYNAPGKFSKRVGAASMAPTMQAMGGLFQGGGGRALIRQRNMLGMGARSMAKMGRFVPGGALAFGGIDAAMRMAQGEDAGKAIGGAAASTIGATLGGILGQALIPVPGVGAMIGTVAGGFLGDKVFNALMPASNEQLEAAALQKQAALQQAQAAGLAKSGVDVEKAGGQFNFGTVEELTKRFHDLGLSSDVAVRSFQSLYRIDQEKQLKAQAAADALNAEIQRLRALGRPSEEIAVNVRGLQTVYNNAQTEAQASLTALNTQWSKIGTESSRVILNSFKTMPVGQVEAAIADKIRQARVVAHLSRGVDREATTPPPKAKAFGGAGKSFSSLAGAINFENKHKPPGSSLVIANSSERIIPAANGYIPSQSLYSRGYAGWSSSGEITVNAPITINGAGQDSEQIATRVADLLASAIETRLNASMYA
jgi:hypothetical protein